jgi:large subunit ribosomal protein L17
MRHRKDRLKLNRFTSWRKATLVSLTRSLLLHQSIKTTQTKAQAVRPMIEKIISLAKVNTLLARRKVYRILGDHKLVSYVFNDIAPRFNQRISGYTRILNLGNRRGDNARMVILELTEIKEKKLKKVKKEVKPEEVKPTPISEKPVAEKKPKPEVKVLEKPTVIKKPTKKFLGGLRSIFKKERDAL